MLITGWQHWSHSTLDKAFSPIENEDRINKLPETKQRKKTSSQASSSVHSTTMHLEPDTNGSTNHENNIVAGVRVMFWFSWIWSPVRFINSGFICGRERKSTLSKSSSYPSLQLFTNPHDACCLSWGNHRMTIKTHCWYGICLNAEVFPIVEIVNSIPKDWPRRAQSNAHSLLIFEQLLGALFTPRSFMIINS